MSSKRIWAPLAATVFAVGVISLTSAAAYPAVAQAADSPAADARLARGNWFGAAEDGAALAEALGISEEELEAAIETAQQAAIDRAVAEGRLTEEQAEMLAERALGRFGRLGRGDNDTLLAEALGITTDELAAAREQVLADRLAQAVEEGDLTQEQVDRIQAQRAFREYQRDQAQAEREASIQAALEAGAITQEQADLLLENLEQGFWGRGFFGHGFLDQRFGGMRGRGFGDGGMRWGFPGGGWRFPGQMPEEPGSPDLPDDTEEQGSTSSYTVPATNL